MDKQTLGWVDERGRAGGAVESGWGTREDVSGGTDRDKV